MDPKIDLEESGDRERLVGFLSRGAGFDSVHGAIEKLYLKIERISL
jgi:hypothetical protein